MSRLAIAAAVLAAGWSVSAGAAYADPAPAPPPPGPKTTFEGDGTYAVGTDIAPGVYAVRRSCKGRRVLLEAGQRRRHR